MDAEKCNLMSQNGHFYDITHTFKIGSATYHVLGLRRDRPTYKNTYYIFDCTNGHQHPSRNRSLSKSSFLKNLTARSGRTSSFAHPSHINEPVQIISNNDGTINETSSSKGASGHHRARTASPKKGEINATLIKDTCTKAIKIERQIFVSSLRKEINLKKKVILRSIKKEKQAILKATSEANNKEEIIRLLEEQKHMLTDAFENFVNTTTASIDDLKQKLTETVDLNRSTSESMEQLQLTVIQTIEQEVQKLTLKNQEILKLMSTEVTAINQLENTLVQKLENFSTKNKNNDNVTLKNLFDEQNKTLTTAITQQQQQQQQQQPIFSLDLIKQTMVDAIKEHQATSSSATHSMEHSQRRADNKVIFAQDPLENSGGTTANNADSLPTVALETKSDKRDRSIKHRDFKKSADRHLFKVSVRSPEPAHLYAKLVVDGMEYPGRLYTMCQRDVIQNDLYNCYIAPPPNKDGFYDITIYAKTNQETKYRAAISIRFPGPSISSSITFPLLHQSFEQHQCILIEPLQRQLRHNEQVLIHMIVPGAHTVKIRNGDENCELNVNEYKDDVVKKKIRVRGDVNIVGCWNRKTDSTICVFNMIP